MEIICICARRRISVLLYYRFGSELTLDSDSPCLAFCVSVQVIKGRPHLVTVEWPTKKVKGAKETKGCVLKVQGPCGDEHMWTHALGSCLNVTNLPRFL